MTVARSIVMLDRLPVELVLRMFEMTAYYLIEQHAGSLAALSVSCRLANDTITPVLHRVLEIDHWNNPDETNARSARSNVRER